MKPHGVATAVAAGGLLRLALWAAVLGRTGTSAMASGDTASYLDPGQNLLWHGCFFTAGLAEIGRTPGYPLFLAVCWTLGPAFAALLQAGISTVCIYLVARLTRAVFHAEYTADVEYKAWLAAWFFALEPVSIVYSQRLLSETLFVFLLLLALERVAACFVAQRSSALLAGGLWMAAAAFVRPIGFYLPLVVALVLFGFLPLDRRTRLRAASILLLASMPWLLAWQARNYLETGYAGFSSIAVRNAYFYSAAEVQSRADALPFASEQQQMGYGDEAAYVAAHPEQHAWSQSARLQFQKREAWRIFSAHPRSLIRAQMMGSAVVAFTPCAADLYRLLDVEPEDAPTRIVHEGVGAAAVHLLKTHPAQAAGMALLEMWLLVLYGLALRGLFSRASAPESLVLLLAVSLWFLAASGGVQAVGRYRLPVMPVVCVLSAAGWRKATNR